MLDYVRLLEANNTIQTIGDDTYWLCVTRTVQESKLFPVPSYMLLGYINCFYRYPELLRKVEASMRAEEIGDRTRAMGGKLGVLPGWALPTFYLIGREILINFGLLDPADAAEDVAYVMDFYRRFKLAQQREDGHVNAREFGQRIQLLPERRVQRLHSELHSCKPGDRLNQAAQAFLATISQYGFLVSCESRCTLNNSGPYKLGDDREMIVREFSDLAEGDYPWLDGVAADIPYAHLTVTMEATGCQFYLMDDWGSFESRPEFTPEMLTGVGLYTSDALSEGFVPVGMGSAEELADTFEDLTARFRTATVELWKRMATWSRDEMMDAGALVYFSLVKDLAHVAGVYDVNDWMTIDPRTERFRPLLNDEFGRDFLGSIVGLVDLPSQQLHDYVMMQHNNNPVRYLSQIPYSVLSGAGTPSKLAPIGPGVTHLGDKQDRYTTTAGPLTLADFNARAAAFKPVQMADEYRFICDTTAKYAAESDPVRALYELEQAGTPLEGKGAGLSRDQVEQL
ncbi:MAG TPA: hypothetical protein VF470_05015, partial [Sphingomicrobium sp.]